MVELLRRLVPAGTPPVVRVPVRGDVAAGELRASTAWYPLVGLAVGTVPALALLLPLPALPRATLALAAWVAVTGALHLDGWADCCDAAFAPPRGGPEETRSNRLAILRDPHVGTFGMVGLFLLLLGKWSALVYAGALAPLLAAVLARWAMVLVLHRHPPARTDGLGATFAGPLPLAAATALLAMIALPLTWSGGALPVVGAIAAGTLVAVVLAGFLSHRFGGITGDVCGAVGESVELAAMWALLPWWLA